MDEAQCGQRQGQAMRDGKGGDRLHQPAEAAHDQDQASHEQQMVDAEQDMRDPEVEIAPGIGRLPSPGQQQRRAVGPQHLGDFRPIGELDLDQRVENGALQPHYRDLAFGQSRRGAFDQHTADRHAWRRGDVRAGHRLALVGK
jgi:hypothetical protein